MLGMIFGPLLSCGLLQIACASTSVERDEGSIGYDLGPRFHVYIAGGMMRNLGFIAIYPDCSWQHIMH